jgi:hypothetical protein
MKNTKLAEVQAVELNDLRGISRRAEACLTTVRIFLDPGDDRNGMDWILCGSSDLHTTRDRPTGKWILSARMTEGVTDVEHDSAYVFKLPLVGLTFTDVYYHTSRFSAWVDPNVGEWLPDFRVPLPGYDPTKHPEAFICTDCKESHVIVPEGFYVPKFEANLYKLVAGKQVEISIGAVYNTAKLAGN